MMIAIKLYEEKNTKGIKEWQQKRTFIGGGQGRWHLSTLNYYNEVHYEKILSKNKFKNLKTKTVSAMQIPFL